MTPIKPLFIEAGLDLFEVCQLEVRLLPEVQRQIKDERIKTLLNAEISAAHNYKVRFAKVLLEMKIEKRMKESARRGWIFDQTCALIMQCKKDRKGELAVLHPLQQLYYHKITALGNLRALAIEINELTYALDFFEMEQEAQNLYHTLCKISNRREKGVAQQKSKPDFPLKETGEVARDIL